jgi:ABC-type polysaccharide/polyol phosphate transport system ATPase subunit
LSFKYKYQGEKEGLKNINFKVGRNQTLGIIGSNGSGKSTIMNLITGIVQNDKGFIRINGKEIFMGLKEARE